MSALESGCRNASRDPVLSQVSIPGGAHRSDRSNDCYIKGKSQQERISVLEQLPVIGWLAEQSGRRKFAERTMKKLPVRWDLDWDWDTELPSAGLVTGLRLAWSSLVKQWGFEASRQCFPSSQARIRQIQAGEKIF